jgi:hypothetical protein
LGANLAAETSGDTAGAGTDGAFLASLLGGGTSVAASVFGGEADNAQADCGSGDGLVQRLLYGITEQVGDLLSC